MKIYDTYKLKESKAGWENFHKGSFCWVEHLDSNRVEFIMNGEEMLGSRTFSIEAFEEDFEKCDATIYEIKEGKWESYHFDDDCGHMEYRKFCTVVAESERKAQNVFKKIFSHMRIRFSGAFPAYICSAKHI